MKQKKRNPHLTVYRSNGPMYPNAADARYFAGKALDVILAFVSGMGLVTAMVVLVTLT